MKYTRQVMLVCTPLVHVIAPSEQGAEQFGKMRTEA